MVSVSFGYQQFLGDLSTDSTRDTKGKHHVQAQDWNRGRLDARYALCRQTHPMDRRTGEGPHRCRIRGRRPARLSAALLRGGYVTGLGSVEKRGRPEMAEEG